MLFEKYKKFLMAVLLPFLLAACQIPHPFLPVATPTLVGDVIATFTPAPSATPAPTYTPTPVPTRASTPTPTATASPSPTQTPTITPTPTPALVQLVLTEAKANELARQKLADKNEVPLKDLQIDFRPGTILLTGKSKVGFFFVNVVISLQVQAQEGKPQITVSDITIGGLPASGSMRQRIEAMMSPHLADLALVSDNFYAENIEIDDDKMITTGHYR